MNDSSIGRNYAETLLILAKKQGQQEEWGALIDAIAGEKPLAGRPLDDVLGWDRPAIGPGCYCEPSARQHKWGLVLETIHYALTHMPDTER